MTTAAARRRGKDAAFAVRRQSRRPRRPLLVRAAVAVVAIAAAAAGVAWLLTADLFAVARVETGAYRFSDGPALESALGRLLRRNIWRVGRDDVAGALAGLPWVRDVSVSRRLPTTLAVEIQEWRPLLEVVPAGGGASGGPLVLVGDGRVLPFPAALPAPGLPVLLEVPAPRDSTGVRRLAADQLAATLDVLDAIAATGLEAAAPVDFIVARPDGFAIVLQGDRGRLLVGRSDFAARLQRYMIARDHLEEGLEVDLRFGERIPVRRPEGT